MTTLEGKVALVAGATRGAGRGIARALGEAGAKVYCTGRSSRAGEVDPARPETIEETAELVSADGGEGIAVRVDHTVQSEVEQLVERVRDDSGRLHVLVNDIWGGDALTEWGKRFWEVDLEQGFRMIERAVHTHVITSRFATPLLLESCSDESGGLIVEVTDGAFAGYRSQIFYDLCKMATIRLAYAMSVELELEPITAVAVTPGFLRSEAVLDHFGVTEATWREAIAKDLHFEQSETPRLVGRGIAALAADPDRKRWAGQALSSWQLSHHYDLRDVDGRRPHWDDHMDATVEETLAKSDPTADELMVLQFRKPQLDFDPDRAEQRERIAAFLKRHRSN